MFGGPITTCLCPALLLVTFMCSVLMLSLILVGDGYRTACPAKGIAWPVIAGFYLVSDVTLAVAFEPILQFYRLSGREGLLSRPGKREDEGCNGAHHSPFQRYRCQHSDHDPAAQQILPQSRYCRVDRSRRDDRPAGDHSLVPVEGDRA